MKGGLILNMSKKGWEYSEQTQTLIGQTRKKLQDLDTGEVIEVDQITKRALGQKQFWKVYLMDFLAILGIIDSKQLDVLIYILENTTSANNVFLGTYRQIAEKTEISLDTVRRTMVKLQQKGFIKKIQNGAYQVSPNIMMKGNDRKKQLLLNYYDDQALIVEAEEN